MYFPTFIMNDDSSPVMPGSGIEETSGRDEDRFIEDAIVSRGTYQELVITAVSFDDPNVCILGRSPDMTLRLISPTSSILNGIS